MQNLTSLPETTARILIIRLSAIGDIIQALDSVRALKSAYPKSEIHWVIKKEFIDLVQHHPFIDRVWAFEKSDGLRGWLALANHLKGLHFSHIYDAHNNFRSRLLTLFFLNHKVLLCRRPKNRLKRLMLFVFRKNQFDNWPFRGRVSFLKPLEAWGVATDLEDEVNLAVPEGQVPDRSYVTLVPSAAWPLKRWPINNWAELIKLMPEENFKVLGGPKDHHLFDLLKHDNVEVLLGKKGLLTSLEIIAHSKAVVGNDTGLTHAADQLKIPTVFLIGPTAFGYPASTTSQVVETQLKCKPCSKDGNTVCRNKITQKCMIDLSPIMVANTLREALK